MEAKPCISSIHPTQIAAVFLMYLLLAGPTPSYTHHEWFQGLDLEPALGQASLVMVGRVAHVSETKIVMGGKGERSLLQFRFEPVLVLKGVFSRESLSLTSDDLGVQRFADASPIESGQFRLLMLGRSMQGYAIRHESSSLEQAIPQLRDQNDPLLETVKVLLAVSASPDRASKVALLLEGLRTQKGAPAVPLLAALKRRALLAAQAADTVEVLSPHLSDSSPAVREQAANTLHELLETDSLDQPRLRDGAVNALRASLEMADPDVEARVAAFEALGAVGPRAIENRSVQSQFDLSRPLTFREQGARLHALGQLKGRGQEATVMALVKQMPLDAPAAFQYGAEWALARLDPPEGIRELVFRVKRKYDSGLSVVTDIDVLGDLPSADAAPALLEVSKLSLDHAEQYALASACRKVADPRLVAPLGGLLVPNRWDIWWEASEALARIDTDEAAKAFEPHLRQETNLLRKLEMAGFLGRHGIRDGYPYAIEHMSDPDLREQAISALGAIREPRAVGELRKILETSNDAAWNIAAVRALGKLGAVELVPRFLELARSEKSLLAPSAIIALGDLHDARALEIVRAGFSSRNTEILTASARAAGNLAALPGMSTEDIRDLLSSLLADSAAPQEARAAALDSLVALDDRRLDGALARAVRDAGLEGSSLLLKIEKLLRERKVKLTLQ
ncbi:MAG: HEAT repeat domain-containing protein [Acidobacteriia bacterium]|nr:HEAT repeat domain-containing protein [Terriglobia bacterium]